ncbi:hypothetical protein C0J52_28073 [Blattella germanica]|nr:hypothetical protein C0J52_28073 [Blattella germanica]
MDTNSGVEKTEWKKRKPKKERKQDLIKSKKIKGDGHFNHKGKYIPARVTGSDCKCTRLQCFQKISEDARTRLMVQFNSMESKNDQDSHLAGLISCNNPCRRRPRVSHNRTQESSGSDGEEKSYANSSYYTYKVRVNNEEINVCYKAFLSLHGIQRGRLRRIQQSLISTGIAPKDSRGKHNSHKHKTPKIIESLIIDHIESFKARQSHYSRRSNPNRLYLPETLSVKDMHRMFLDSYHINVSYQVYWLIFSTKFNIKFGYPRSDTCSVCDSLQLSIVEASSDTEKCQYLTEKELHLARADKFFELKRLYKKKAASGEMTFISFDFMQNLPLPHIRTCDVFYSRQLWYYVFGIHDIGKNQVFMNVYDELTGKRGQNNVTSMLLKYFNMIGAEHEHLVLMSDGCPGQNKNYHMVHFIYMLVHWLKLFNKVTYIFPMRGHSYLPNDQDFSLIEAKKRKHNAEVHSDWDALIRSARQKPEPFNVINIVQQDFFDLHSAFKPFFLPKSRPNMKLKGVRMLEFSSDYTHIKVRHTYTGPWDTICIRNTKKLPSSLGLTQLYLSQLPLNPSKVKDLQKLSKYLQSAANRDFYLHLSTLADDCVEDVHIDNDDNSSGEEQ